MAVLGIIGSRNGRQFERNKVSLKLIDVVDIEMNGEKPTSENDIEACRYPRTFQVRPDISTEEKRVEFLQELSCSLKANRDLFVYEDQAKLFTVLSQALADSTNETRTLALEFLYDYIPLCGRALDEHMGIIFPKLVQNLLNVNSSLKKSTLQTLHIYFKHSLDASLVLQYVTQYGVNSANSSIRDEVLMALPVLVKAGFGQEHLQDLFVSLIRLASKMDEAESTLALVLCLDHIRKLMGIGFDNFINACPPTLNSVYKRTIRNSSLNVVRQESLKQSHSNDDNSSATDKSSGEHSTDVSPKVRSFNPLNVHVDSIIRKESFLVFGFIPQYVIDQLDNTDDWKCRSHGMDELLLIIDGVSNPLVLMAQAGPLIDYMSKFVDDVNFKIVLNTLNVIYKLVLKTGLHIGPCLQRIVEILVSKLGDPKVIVRQLTLKLVKALMESLSPSTVLAELYPFLQHKNARIREEIVNIVTSALLQFPSSDFDLRNISAKMVPLLLDSKVRVRHALLEGLAVLAQQLGQGRLHPLVSAVDKVEIQHGGDGALNAVQTRLSRRMLPRLSSDGLVEFALSLNTSDYNNDIAPDVAWILAGSSGSAIEGSRNTPGLDSSLGNSSRPYFSAGKKKLPWKTEDKNIAGTRKSVASAPIRSVDLLHSPNEDGKEVAPPIQDSWMGDAVSGSPENASCLGNYTTKAKLLNARDGLQYPSQYQRSESDGSYFEMYKKKMKKMKAAGLHADSNIINSMNRSGDQQLKMAQVPHLPQKKVALRPTHFVGDLFGVAAGNKLLSPSGNGHLLSLSPGDDGGRVSHSSSDASELRLVHSEASDSSPGSLNSTVDSEDIPIPLKPSLARSASKKHLKLGLLQDKPSVEMQFPYHQGSIDAQSPISSSPKSLGLGKRNVGDLLGSPFPLKPTIVRSPSGSVKKNLGAINQEVQWPQVDFSQNSANLVEMKKLSKSSPAVANGYGTSLRLDLDDSFEKSVSIDIEDHLGLDSKHKSPVAPVPSVQPNRFGYPQEHGLDGAVGVSPRVRPIGTLKYSPRALPHADLNPAHGVLHQRSPRTQGETSALADVTDDNNNNNNNSERHHFARTSEDEDAGAMLAQSAREKMRKLKEQHLQQMQSQLATTMINKESDLEKSPSSVNRADGALGEAASPSGRSLKIKAPVSANADETNAHGSSEKKLSSSQDSPGTVSLSTVHGDAMIGSTRKPSRLNRVPATGQFVDPERQHNEERRFRAKADTPDMVYPQNIASKTSGLAPALASDIQSDLIIEGAAILPDSSGRGDPENPHSGNEWIKEEEAKLMREIERRRGDLVEASRENSFNSDAAVTNSKFRKKSFDGEKNAKSDMSGDNFIVQGQKPVSHPSHPKISASPQIQRKNLSSSTNRPADLDSVSSATSKSLAVVRTGVELEQVLSNPQVSLSDAMKLLASNSEDWEAKCEGLMLVRRLARHHSDALCLEVHAIVAAVLLEVKNLRSQVTRAALECIADLLGAIPRPMEPELDIVVKTVVSKAGDTNQFIREDAIQVLDNVAEFVQPSRALAAVISAGASHRNAIIRKACAKTIADIAEKVEPVKLPSASKDLAVVAAKLALDPQPEARYHGRRILHMMLDDPGLEPILEKQLPQANMRPLKDVLENLRNKGLGEMPSDGSSAQLRKSVRNPSSMYSPASTRKARSDLTADVVKVVSAKSKDVAALTADPEDGGIDQPIRKSRKSTGKDELAATRGAQLNIDCLDRLDSADWNERLTALEDFYDYVSLNPSVVSAHAIKVFDKFCPRLNDSNSKVSLTALQVLDRCIPILRNGMSATTTIVIDNLKLPLASKNESIYFASKNCLVSLTKYVDHAALIQPLATSLQFGSKRTKPEMADLLAGIVIPVYGRKPGLVNRIVLPVIWNVLSSAGSGSGSTVANRVGMSQAMSRLCSCVYQCLGDVFLQEAASQGSRVLQRLEAFLK